jgi:hypothetical protein
MTRDWILFALGVVVMGVVWIGFGLLVAGRLSAWGERHGDADGGTVMTEVGPPGADDGAPDAGTPEGEAADD